MYYYVNMLLLRATGETDNSVGSELVICIVNIPHLKPRL